MDQAFRKIQTGHCLSQYWEDKAFSEKTPSVVACDRDNAYLHVTRVGTSSSACSESGEGRSYWRSPDGGTVLCVERVFHVGDCFPVQWTQKDKNSDIRATAELFTQWPCSSNEVPSGNNGIVRITKIYKWQTGQTYPCGRDAKNRNELWYPLEDRKISICSAFTD
ncbi:hypothetical protein [Yinghuangia soli]|uniref:Uncharacterized protein n=1 Tax=Yinghuangia soli TaxID=2908204 RepID=A0AA41U026_9ACTN|nr:hypothetical protein [Yinghuangia soli]MCF2525992.1 hypothetical protein [Yinghuangia soli]